MIINPSKLSMKVFKCRHKIIKSYLIYEIHLPILSIENDIYYFVYNNKLKQAIENSPFWVKTMINFENLN